MKKRLFSILVVLVVLLGQFAGNGNVRHVKADYPDCYVRQSAAGLNNGLNWTDAYTDLQSALGNSSCTAIHVAAGTYSPTGVGDGTDTFQLRSGVEIIGGYPASGADTPLDPVTNVTILNGNDFNYHVVTAGSGVDSSALLDGFTIQGGSADDSSPNNKGAGIYVNGGSPSLQNLIISGNNSDLDGGGMYLTNSSASLNHVRFVGNHSATGGGLYEEGTGSPTLSDVTFDTNSASAAGGGTGGGAAISGDATLNNVTFQNNTAGSQGAGLLIIGGSPSLNTVSFTGNIVGPGSGGGNGGGMYIRGGSPSLTGVTFSNNSANDLGGINGGGGGLFVLNAIPNLNTVTFQTNSADASGGGIYVDNGSAVLNNVLFNGNKAGKGSRGGSGGGMYNANGAPNLTEVTFRSNEAHGGGGIGGNGGGLYLSGTSASLANVTFDSNKAVNGGAGGNGGGLYISGINASLTDISITNNIADTSIGGGGGIYISNANPSLSNVTVSGNESYHGGGVYITGGSPILSNMAISSNTYHGSGGGIYLYDGSPVLTNITISGSGGPYSASMKGGGLLSEAGSNPELNGVTFSSNMAHDGGGMYSTNGQPHLTKVTFQSNTAVSGNGGGLFINSGYGSLSDSLFDSNDGYNGAGIYLNGGRLDMQDSLIENCVSSGGDGGGAYLTSGSDTYLRDNTFTNNSTSGTGGGLYVAGRITMTGGTVSENVSTTGTGGAGLELNGSSLADFTNVSIDHNTTTAGWGGGIRSDNSSATFTNLRLTRNTAWQSGGMMLQNSDVTILNASIAHNDAAHEGVAIFKNGGNLSISNSIVWAHRDGLSSINSASAVHSSLLEDGCPAGATCTGLVSGDPMFVDQANGDYRLPPLSAAVDAGDASALPADQFDVDGDGNLSESIPVDLRGEPRLVLGRVDLGAYEAQVWNANWTQATTLLLEPIQPGLSSVDIDRYVDLPGQSRWYKFSVRPDSKVIVTLTGLPANYDLALYKDISQIYSELTSSQDLVQLSAEFAPDTFSPDTFSPDTFSPDTFSPDTFSPDTFSPDTFSPDTFSPDTFSPDTFSPDTFSPDTFSPDTFSPDTFSPDTFSPDTFSPDTFSPDTFSSAQTRGLIAISAHAGTQGEGILVNTWTKTGDFYLRVRGRNGVYDANIPFHLQVSMLSGSCGPVSPVLPASDTDLPAGSYQTLILTNLAQTEGTNSERTLQTKLATLASRTTGQVVDVGDDARVSAAFSQAQDHPACVYAMNLQAEAIKNIVDKFRGLNTGLEYIVLVGNDHIFPFFRYTDNTLLASEIDYSPPVLDDTTSQASLKSGYILSQDAYGAAVELSYKAGTLPVPDLAVGRLVETASDITHILDAYLGTADGIVTPTNALVTGYDFLEDAANAVGDELQGGLGPTAVVDTLIMPRGDSPQDPSAWTADDLRHSLLDSSHDMVFLAGHFSASSALAADYKTHLMASEVLASSTDFSNSLVYSAGCHSGYNIVNADGVPNVTEEPDWAQTFAAKGATFIGGTGYQYGDTDFIEYSERLYLEFTRQLRSGSGQVAVGKALVQAKQAYLANTPLMRGIHEKTVLEATLFGLPMLQFKLLARTPAPPEPSLVTGTTTFTDNPGNRLGLKYADLHVIPTFTDHSVTLDLTSGNGEPTMDAYYLEGPDGVVVNPSEPVLPLDMLNVSSPEAGFVLRGAGWRGGVYTNLTDRLPLTGAATDDLRAPHMAFFSDMFFPVRPWNINYFDALGDSGGITHLALMPAQYRSTNPGSLTGIIRRFDAMDFRLYYSSNFATYTNPIIENDWTNTPALSAPPDISHIASTINPDGTVSFEVTVTGDPAAGVQEAWIVYTFENDGLSGTWQPLDLEQDADDSRLWKGTLVLGEASYADMRFIVQAVNGVGLVTMMTNQGAYYRPAVDPAAPPQGQSPVTLTLDAPAPSGSYGGQQAFTAIVTPSLAGLPVTFSLGGLGRLAVTDSDGRATVHFFLAARPGEYTLDATFNGNDGYAPAASSSPFEIKPGSSDVVLDSEVQNVLSFVSAQFTASVTTAGLPLAGKSVALTLDTGNVRKYTGVAVTDFAGKARWQVPAQTPGEYAVKAWFGLPVSDGLDLSSPFYSGSSANGILTVNQRTGLAIQYSGDTYLLAGTTSATLKAQLSGPPVCLNNQTVTFMKDANGDGTYETTLGTRTTDSSGLASIPLSGLTANSIYEIEISVPDGNCNGAVNTGTLMVAGSGDSSNGGGYYTLTGAGRINFGYTLQVKTTKTGTTVSGQILWHVQAKTRLKGTITAYNKACPSGTTAPAGTTCGYLTGSGSLYAWNSTTNSWTLTASNVGFQVTAADGGSGTSCTKKGCSIVLKPDYFRMNLPSVVVSGESTTLTQLKGGNILVK